MTIFAADKVAKVRELRLGTGRTSPRPVHASGTRHGCLAHYRECLRLLEQRLPDSRLVGELRAELGKAARDR